MNKHQIDLIPEFINQAQYFKDITDLDKESVIRQIIQYSNNGIIKINDKVFEIKEIVK